MRKFSSGKKLLLSLLVFLVALTLTLGVGQMLKTPRKMELATQQNPTTEESAVFYEAVGQAPSDFEGASLKLPEKFTVEILATQDQVEAEKLIGQLSQKNIQAFYTPLQQNEHVVYRVRQGIYTDHSQATLAAKKLRKEGISGKVIRLD